MRRTRSILGFAVLAIVISGSVAIAEGVGGGGLEAGQVAKVAGVPDDLGEVSEADYERAFRQSVAQAGLRKAPKRGSKKYREVSQSALAAALQEIWIRGEAAEMNVSVTDKQVEERLAEVKKQSFSGAGDYQKFLKTYRYTKADVEERIEAELLSEEIESEISEGAAKPSDAQIEEDYEAKSDTEFTTQATRDARIVYNQSKAKVVRAKAELEADGSVASWKQVAKRYSISSLRSNGGLQSGLSRDSVEEPFGSKLFSAPRGKLEGPLKISGGYLVFEVEKETPRKTRTLDEVRSQIKSSLTKSLREEALSAFSSAYGATWVSRTTCASDHISEYCSNHEASGRAAETPAGCYDPNAKGGLPDSCPAPVQQSKPASPGSVTLLQPEGERLVQRPLQPSAKSPKDAKEEPLAAAGVTPSAIPLRGHPPAGRLTSFSASGAARPTAGRGRASAAAEPTFVPATDPGVAGSSRLRRGVVGETATASVTGTAATDYSAPPASANGVLVGAFPQAGGEQEYRCSASVIDSATGNLVLTAAHCVVDPETAAVARWLVFVPGYHEGKKPFGEWAVTEFGVTQRWAAGAGSPTGASEAGDIAILRIQKREADGASVQSVVGALGIGFDQPRNQTYTLYGYPSRSPYDGERLFSEESAYAGLDSRLSPATIKVSSDFTEGASGGPWTVGTSSPVALSLNAYEYTEAPGYLYGPFFGAEAKSLYRNASSTTPAETGSERLRLTAVQHLPRHGLARLHVSVPLDGTLSLRGRGVVPIDRRVRGGSSNLLVLRVRGAFLRTLHRTGHVAVVVVLTNKEQSTGVERQLRRTVQLIER